MQKVNLKLLSGTFGAYLNSKKSNVTEWIEKHEDRVNELCKALPSGSGIDAGIKFDWDNSTPEKLIFLFGYHHMNEGGYYDGWTAHKLIITPSLQFGFNLKVTGQNRNGIKEYLTDLFHQIFYS